jgi:hypothetical protein
MTSASSREGIATLKSCFVVHFLLKVRQFIGRAPNGSTSFERQTYSHHRVANPAEASDQVNAGFFNVRSKLRTSGDDGTRPYRLPVFCGHMEPLYPSEVIFAAFYFLTFCRRRRRLKNRILDRQG